MNRLFALFLAGLFGLPSCRESGESSRAEAFESTSVVRLQPFPMAEGKVDWNREAELLQSGELFEELSARLDLTEEQLREAVRFELEILEEKVRIIARDEEAGAAQKICEAYAGLYLEKRKEMEREAARAAWNLIKQNLPMNGQESGEGTLDRDRVTYQKALEALKESEEVPEDGVLYRKEE